MQIRYLLTHPFSFAQGGASVYIASVLKKLSERGHQIRQLDFLKKEIDFDCLFIFDFTFYEPEVLEFYKKKGVKIVLFPIFDRVRPVWQLKLLKNLTQRQPLKASFHFNRVRLLDIASHVIVANKDEMRDLQSIYDLDERKALDINLGISDDIISLDKTISKDLFVQKYGWENFVFCPAIFISKRKNQLSLIKALKGTGIKLVLNNTDNIHDGLEQEFLDLTAGDPNILCLGKLDFDMLISCYKAAKVSVSVSLAETAGLVNLEAGYLGCNLAVSDLQAFREYLKDFAIYFDPLNPAQIKEAVKKCLSQNPNIDFKKFIEANYTWDSYVDKLETIL